MITVLKKTPAIINEFESGKIERITYNSKEQLISEIKETFSNYEIIKISHPTVPAVYICYSSKPGEQSNFRIGINGNWIRGTAFFVGKDLDLSEEQCDRVIHSLKKFLIRKEYLEIKK